MGYDFVVDPPATHIEPFQVTQLQVDKEELKFCEASIEVDGGNVFGLDTFIRAWLPVDPMRMLLEGKVMVFGRAPLNAIQRPIENKFALDCICVQLMPS
ncbi:MAG: hypothetical protein EBR59_10440 [Methylococcaceae bacterium]|nr:hypothetical protein [Methylococcaceae bacterium]